MNPDLVTTTAKIDAVFLYIFGISMVMLAGITVTMLYFVFRYHRSRHPRSEASPRSNLWLETTWTVIPTALVLSMFYYGWDGYLTLRNVPEDAFEVQVTARKWSWQFDYPNGRRSDKLYVPAGRPVKVAIRSVDVLHNFYIPAFRTKIDAVPGMETSAWFVATEPGSFDLFCAEYCGVGHADMITTVEALPQAEFDRWYAARKAPASQASGAEAAEELLETYGCTGCHSLDGSPGVGPSLQGLAGSVRTVLSGGVEKTVPADAAYLRRALLEPNAELVKGFPAIMPPYGDQIPEEELKVLIAYLLDSSDPPAPPSGEQLAKDNGCLGCHSTDGSRRAGPTFRGILGRPTRVLRDGRQTTLKADRPYLRQSILAPEAEVVEGYPAIMPPFTHFSEAELEAVLDYLGELE